MVDVVEGRGVECALVDLCRSGARVLFQGCGDVIVGAMMMMIIMIVIVVVRGEVGRVLG